jgi:hypothetical protein
LVEALTRPQPPQASFPHTDRIGLFGSAPHRLQLRGRTRSSKRETERAAAWVHSALTLLAPPPTGVWSISVLDPATHMRNTVQQ